MEVSRALPSSAIDIAGHCKLQKQVSSSIPSTSTGLNIPLIATVFYSSRSSGDCSSRSFKVRDSFSTLQARVCHGSFPVLNVRGLPYLACGRQPLQLVIQRGGGKSIEGGDDPCAAFAAGTPMPTGSLCVYALYCVLTTPPSAEQFRKRETMKRAIEYITD